MHYETIHTETRDGFDIVFSVAPEDTDPRGFFDDDGEAVEAIRNGEFVWFIARVEVKKAGITLGTDYLGGCCYRSAYEFVTDGDCYHDMVEQAMSEACDTLAALAA